MSATLPIRTMQGWQKRGQKQASHLVRCHSHHRSTARVGANRGRSLLQVKRTLSHAPMRPRPCTEYTPGSGDRRSRRLHLMASTLNSTSRRSNGAGNTSGSVAQRRLPLCSLAGASKVTSRPRHGAILVRGSRDLDRDAKPYTSMYSTSLRFARLSVHMVNNGPSSKHALWGALADACPA